MEPGQPICQATTKAGTRCKNHAKHGSNYCSVHLHLGAEAPAEDVRPEAPSRLTPARTTKARPQQWALMETSVSGVDLLVHELEALARELQRRVQKRPPPTPAQLLGMLNRSVGRYAPEVPREVLRDLERNLEGTSYQDLVDPETLKGLWYVLTYSVQGSTQEVRARLDAQLSSIPGYAAMKDLAGNFEGTTPRDLVDPDTWKGFLYIVSYTAQNQVRAATQRVLGATAEDQEPER